MQSTLFGLRGGGVEAVQVPDSRACCFVLGLSKAVQEPNSRSWCFPLFALGGGGAEPNHKTAAADTSCFGTVCPVLFWKKLFGNPTPDQRADKGYILSVDISCQLITWLLGWQWVWDTKHLLNHGVWDHLSQFAIAEDDSISQDCSLWVVWQFSARVSGRPFLTFRSSFYCSLLLLSLSSDISSFVAY